MAMIIDEEKYESKKRAREESASQSDEDEMTKDRLRLTEQSPSDSKIMRLLQTAKTWNAYHA